MTENILTIQKKTNQQKEEEDCTDQNTYSYLVNLCNTALSSGDVIFIHVMVQMASAYSDHTGKLW